MKEETETETKVKSSKLRIKKSHFGVKAYCVLQDDTPIGVSNMANVMIQSGWQPLGGLTCDVKLGGNKFVQAMVKMWAALLILHSSLFTLNCSAAELPAWMKKAPNTWPACVSDQRGGYRLPQPPYMIRYDRMARNLAAAPGVGVREDLVMPNGTWVNAKFGPMRRSDGHYYIRVSAQTAAWIAADDLPQCLCQRFGLNGVGKCNPPVVQDAGEPPKPGAVPGAGK